MVILAMRTCPFRHQSYSDLPLFFFCHLLKDDEKSKR
jgi:hypothetical protein